MVKLQMLPEEVYSLQVLNPIIKTGVPIIVAKRITENGKFSAKEEGATGFDPVEVAVDLTPAYDAGYKAGEQEGHEKGVAETEAKNAEILTGCNTQLESRGVESAESLEQVPQKIGEIKAEPIWVKYITGGTYLFYKAKFPPNAEVTVEYSDIASNFDWFMRGAENVKKLTLICENPATTQNPVMMASLCNLISTLETVDLSRFRPKISNLTSAFSTNPMLKEIVGEIDYSLCTHLTNTFSGDYELENIRATPGSIRSTFYINGSPKLTDETIQSIIDGLADLTGAATQTLSLHKTVGNKLTQAQKDAISAKNWTLVY